MADSEFYIGRVFDPKKKEMTSQSVMYDPGDLTTHAVVTGMTGSGKTGLCVNLLEEAALQNVPAIIVDPKGDLTNLLLHFPDLMPQDFQPWIDPDIARRADKTLEQAAQEASASWRKGLQDWGIDRERLLALKNSVQFSVYTPGSNAGIGISVLSSLAAPDLPWDENREILREKVSSTVTAILGLVGIDNIDPLQSREHILLSNLFESAWREGRDIDLTELILQTQNPPFDKLGAFPIDAFFPPKDRMALAMQLNNILAAPAFEAWREGESLDVSSLLYAPDGRPRHSIFYLAHLSDSERMFFVTLLFSAVETWMRTQKGSNALRALLYMDELVGYLPPTAIPPSKPPLLRMLKQARAFGLGLILATQNPVDLDYKALSNAGTWFIGKLQTEQDKNRLLDGLENIAGGVSRNAIDAAISNLGKRVFIMNNVHNKAPIIFQTRWAMNFLAGPLTRTQIPDLNKLAGVEAVVSKAETGMRSERSASTPNAAPASVMSNESMPAAASVKRASPALTGTGEGSQTRPPVPSGIAEYYLPQNYSLPQAFSAAKRSMPPQAMIQGVMYRPALLGAAEVRFLDRKFGVDVNQTRVALVEAPERSGVIRWEDFPYNGSVDKFDSAPTPQARFSMIDAPLNDAKRMAALQKDFADWVYRTSSVKARANQKLKVFAGPDVSQAEFMKACADAAREARDAEIEKKTLQMDRKIKTLQDKLAREERELRQDETELQNRKLEAGANLLELGAGFLGVTRKKSISTQFTKHRLTKAAEDEVQESVDAVAQYKKDLADLQRQREEIMAEVNQAWGDVVNDIEEVTVSPKKTDVYVKLFGVAWMPYYVVQSGAETLELPAFGEE